MGTAANQNTPKTKQNNTKTGYWLAREVLSVVTVRLCESDRAFEKFAKDTLDTLGVI